MTLGPSAQPFERDRHDLRNQDQQEKECDLPQKKGGDTDDDLPEDGVGPQTGVVP